MGDELTNLNLSGNEPTHDVTEIPGKAPEDIAHQAINAAIAGIPFAGGVASRVFETVFQSPLARRRDEWIQAIAIRLVILEQEGKVNFADLSNNEQFVSTATQAAQAVLRTHNKEKREALRNAVLNALTPLAPGETLQQMFIGFVDVFTAWHLRLLHLFDDPQAWLNEHEASTDDMGMGSRNHLLVRAYPELEGRRDLYDQIWRDLFLRGLVGTESLHVMMSTTGMLAQITTPLGRQFIAFITAAT